MKISLEIPNKDNEEIRKAVDNFNTDSEIDKMNAVCFWLISQCVKTNAASMKITQDGVNQFGKEIGSWIISVKTKK